MEWRVTVLCENSVPAPGFLGEHGFSAFIESKDGKSFLFDTGGGFTLVPNSLRLKKDLAKAEAVLLSHGHFDHTGGIMPLLGLKGPTKFVSHPHTFLMRYRLMPLGPVEKNMAIGIPWTKEYLEGRGASFNLVTTLTELAPGAFISGEVPRKTPFETGDPKFSALIDGKLVPDPFKDDFSLYLKSTKGLIVILGCAHAGTINILNHAKESLGEDRIHAVLGGTHLGFSSKDQLKETLTALKAFDIKVLAVSHCTGVIPSATLAKEFETSFTFAQVGFTLEV